MSAFWFARRFAPPSPRKAMAPVSWQGYAVSLAYVSVLTAGGVAFAWLGAGGRLLEGAAIFALAAIVGAGGFILIARAKSDPVRTVDDYRKARIRA